MGWDSMGWDGTARYSTLSTPYTIHYTPSATDRTYQRWYTTHHVLSTHSPLHDPPPLFTPPTPLHQLQAELHEALLKSKHGHESIPDALLSAFSCLSCNRPVRSPMARGGGTPGQHGHHHSPGHQHYASGSGPYGGSSWPQGDDDGASTLSSGMPRTLGAGFRTGGGMLGPVVAPPSPGTQWRNIHGA